MKSILVRLGLSILLLATSLALAGCNRGAASDKKLIAIIVPSQDNPFFKAEADAAATRAREL